MKVRFFNIKWDTDGEDVDLPNEVVMDIDNDIDIALDGANYVSDKFGWCIFSFDFEVL